MRTPFASSAPVSSLYTSCVPAGCQSMTSRSMRRRSSSVGSTADAGPPAGSHPAAAAAAAASWALSCA
eukprot:359194-Chlamydomonas_euryale.AAC.12